MNAIAFQIINRLAEILREPDRYAKASGQRTFGFQSEGGHGGQKSFKWDEKKHPRDEGGKFSEAGHEIVTIPEARGVPAFQAEVRNRPDGTAAIHRTEGEGKDRPLATMHGSQVKTFLGDLAGKVTSDTRTNDDSVNKVLDQKAKFISRGNDGLAFDTGDGNVVKAGSDLAYHWSNGIRQPGEGAKRTKEAAELNNRLRVEGVPGLLEQTVIEHDGRTFLKMPKLTIPEKLTRQQLDQVQKTVTELNKRGYAIGDELQPGLDSQGNAHIYDTGSLSKSGQYGIDDDMDHLKRLFEKNGEKFDNPDAGLAYETQFAEVHDYLKRSPRHGAAHWQRMIDRLEEKWKPLDNDTKSFLAESHFTALAQLDARKAEAEARKEPEAPASKPKQVAVAGMQQGLFNGGERAGGQKSLFNVVKPSAKSKPTDSSEPKLTGRMAEFLGKKDTISPADLAVPLAPKSLPGQKAFFSLGRNGEQVTEALRMALFGAVEKYRKQHDPNEEGHWVTIDGRHVFIKDATAGDHAKSMGKLHRVKAEHVQHLMSEAHQFLKSQIDQREAAKAHARKLSRLNSGSIAKIENSYRDWSSVDGFDSIARDVALAHPELGFDPDDTDTPGKVWDLIREGKEEYPAADSKEVAELAAKWLKSSTPANKQEYPEDALEFSRKGEVYRPMSTFAERVAYALRQRVEKYSFNEQDHPRDESGKFTEKDGDDSGRVRMRQAKAGGEVSEVDGKFYKGGHWLPVHGKYSGQEKPEKKPKQEGDSGPVFASESSKGPVMARQLSPEQVEEERARDREQRDWSGIQSGPLGQLLRLGDRPHNIRRTWGDIRKWAELFESGEITTDGLEDAEQFARNKIRQIEEEKDPSMTADDWRYYAGTVEENSERDREQYAPRSLKKLLNAHPAITNARTWVSYLLDANQDIDTLKEINDRLSGRAEMYSFQESQHPRDEIGRFVEKAASSHAAAKKSAKTVEERRKSYESLVAKREAAGNDDDVSDEEQQAEDQLDVAEAEEEDNRLDAEIAESDAVSAADEAIDALNQEEPDLAKELAVAERNHKRLSGIAAKLREKSDRLKQAAESGDGPVTPEVRAAISNHKKLVAVAAKKRDKSDKLNGVVADLEQQKREAKTQVESYSGQIDDLNKRQNAAIEKYVSVSRDPDTTDEDVDAAYAAMRQIEKEENELARIINPLESAVEKLGDKIDKAKEVQQEAEEEADEADENAAEAFAEIADAKRMAAMELFDEADVDADSAEDEAEQARQELESLREEHSKTIKQRDELKAMRARLPSMIAERIAALLSNVVEKYAAEKDDSRWITIGGADDGTRKHAGGTPVKIDKEGKIVAGPDSLAGKKVDELGSGKRAEEKPVDRGPDPQGSELGKKKDMPGLHDVKIESPGALTNAAYQRAGGGRSMQAKWSLRGPDGFVNLYEITKSNLRGDSPISVDAKLPPGRYVLSTGAGRDRIEHVINVGDQAERDSRAVSAVKKDYEDLEGSSAQVKWAKEIRDKWAVKFSSDPEEIEALAYLGSAKKIIDGRDDYPSNLIDAKRVDITNQNGEVIGSRYISHAAWDRYKNGTSPAWKDGKARAGDALLDVVTELHSINPDEIVSMAERE